MLSDAERQRIEESVRAAERRTSAEIAVVVAAASDAYLAFPILWAALGAILAGGILALAAPDLSAAMLFAIEAVLLVLGSLLLHLEALRLRSAPPAVREAAVKRRAREQFGALVQGRTQQRDGVLLFVSLAERRIELIADAAIAARITDADWQRIVDDAVAVLRRDGLAAGIAAALDGATRLLEQRFPAEPGQRQDLPDAVREV